MEKTWPVKRNVLWTSSLSLTLLLSNCSFQTGCTGYASTNVPIQWETYRTKQAILDKLSFAIKHDRTEVGKKKALVILALSGGGSRAAYFSTATMFALSSVLKDQNLDLLKEVDAISAVSGGALPAAYYAFSFDHTDKAALQESVRYWDESEVKELMTRRYRSRWLANWLWPVNIVKYWFTAFDRTDIMAGILTDNLFDDPFSGRNYRFSDINQERPNLIINATNGTRPTFFDGSAACRLDHKDHTCSHFGDIFSFTQEDFETIGSDLTEYEVGRAVMASAAFPAVFNFMTLRNEKDETQKYIHLFDGGNSDNLGLESTRKIIERNIDHHDRVIVILVDAYIEPLGVSGQRPDVRGWVSYLLDYNVIDSSDSLLKQLRYKRIDPMVDDLKRWQEAAPAQNADKDAQGHPFKKHALFFHLKLQHEKFSDPLFEQLNRIQTDFEIDDPDIKAIDEAVKILITPDNPCIRRIQELLLEDQVSDDKKVYCT